MAATAFEFSAPRSRNAVHFVVGALMEIPKVILAWHHGRKTREALYGLSDAQLDDIGISRGDIDEMAFSQARSR